MSGRDKRKERRVNASDTPRPDAAHGKGNFVHCCDVDDMRQLERELNEALAYLLVVLKADEQDTFDEINMEAIRKVLIKHGKLVLVNDNKERKL